MSDHYGPSSARRNPRKKPRYESTSDDGHSAVYSDKDGDSDSGRSYIPASTASSRRRSSSRSHHNQNHQNHHSDHSHRSHSQRNHQRSHRHSHHRRQKLLGPAEDDDDDEKPRDGTALAVRQEYAVQTVPRAHHRHADGSDDDDDEEVYDHRPKPVSHRSHSHVGVSSGGGRRGAAQASDAGKGFFMAAAALAVSFIICCGDADND